MTINVALLLAVIVVLLILRRVQARSRFDQALTVLTALVLGVLIAPTSVGEGIMNLVRQITHGISQSGQ